MNKLRKPFRKKSDEKIERTVKIFVKMPHENKNTSKHANFLFNPHFLYIKIWE